MARRPASDLTELVESDRLEDFPHPRANPHLTGHRGIMAEVADAIQSGRLHHAWLLSGPKGIGKATLAWRFARTVLKHGAGVAVPADLAVDEEDRVFHWVKALSHPDLLLLRRPADHTGKIQGVIPVEEVRRASDFFALRASQGGWRVCIVDSADDMNISAANALLKILEEPPQRCLFILISHSPGRLLPTIRSRCRKLFISPLNETEVSQIVAAHFPDLQPEQLMLAAKLGQGSPGQALALAKAGGVEHYRQIIGHLMKLPALDFAGLHKLADALAKDASGESFATMTQMMLAWLAEMIRVQAGGIPAQDRIPGEGEAMRRLASSAPLDRWIDVWEKSGQVLRRADSVNLARKQVLLNIFSSLSDTAQAPHSGRQER